MKSLDIYFIAIGGTGMAPLACLLKELGHRVRGADGPLYPPMSTLLDAAGIEPLVGWDPAHLKQSPRPDLVIVGNAVPRHNPEVEAVERLGLSRLSMPEALARFFLTGRKPLVVAGTHGKTTTTAIAAWVWTCADRDPGYLIGGVPLNLERSFEIGTGDRFVIEGDEYNAAYFDRGPKFLHYQPQTLILTSVEYDHADLYPDSEALAEAYRRLVRLLPDDGLLVACGDSDAVRSVAAEAGCRVLFYGLDARNDVRPEGGVSYDELGSRFTIVTRKRSAAPDPRTGKDIEITLAVPGEHNVQNALAVWAAARHDLLPEATVARTLADFRGTRRRLEELGTRRGVTVIDDFAHHPTAVEKSLDGLRRAHPQRRIVAIFEPRSLTAGRALFFDAYRRAFAHADVLLLAPIFHHQRLGAERLDAPALVRELIAAGIDARACTSVDELFAVALAEAREGDVIVTMSSGSFDSLPQRLLQALGQDPVVSTSPVC